MQVRFRSDFSAETVYFTPADASFQRLGRLTQRDFERTVKTWLLLSDTMVVAASHIFESPMTATLLMENPRLLREGIVVPSLRDDSSNFREFVRSHREKGDQTAFFKANFEDLLAMGTFLDANASTTYSWTFGSSSEALKASMLMDLADPVSSLRRRLRGIHGSRLADLQCAIDDMPYVSRERLESAAIAILPERRLLLNSYWDTQYYLNSAAASANVPLLDVMSLRWMPDDFAQASATAHAASLPDCFDELAARMGLSPVLLDTLTVDDAIQLQHSPEGRAFRKAVWIGTKMRILVKSNTRTTSSRTP